MRSEMLRYPLLEALTEVQGDVTAEFMVSDAGKISGDLTFTGPGRLFDAVRVMLRNTQFDPACAGSRKVFIEFRIREKLADDLESVVEALAADHYRISVNQRILHAYDATLSRPNWATRTWRALFRR